MKSRNVRLLSKKKLENLLRGGKEFYDAFGYDERSQERLRSKSMPFYKDEDEFLYDPDEVLTWMKKTFKRPNQ
jgi:hypothetical protein